MHYSSCNERRSSRSSWLKASLTNVWWKHEIKWLQVIYCCINLFVYKVLSLPIGCKIWPRWLSIPSWHRFFFSGILWETRAENHWPTRLTGHWAGFEPANQVSNMTQLKYHDMFTIWHYPAQTDISIRLVLSVRAAVPVCPPVDTSVWCKDTALQQLN